MKIETILKSHGIDFNIVNGRVIAIEVLYDTINKVNVYEEQDVTDFSNRELAIWLGY